MTEPPTTAARSTAGTVNWEAVQDSPDFAKLRHALRSFVFPVTIAFLPVRLTRILLLSRSVVSSLVVINPSHQCRSVMPVRPARSPRPARLVWPEKVP